MSRNRLDEASSPYLLQHKDNPVHWQSWSGKALQQAQAEGKPVLLSVGYAACHWCHVMAHESFEDADTAALMNDLFVNIKVDREERPDIDAIYMNALQLMGHQGGWPLTMFLTPEGKPFWGGTYFPPAPRHGQPAFKDVLVAVHKAYREQGETVAKNTQTLCDALNELTRSPPGFALSSDLLPAVTERLVQQIDPHHGGLRGAPKFPHTGLLALIWRGFLRTGSTDHHHAVTVSLDNMCQGGIYDHLGGGFARYAVDERWLVPHFEKMLYDNAALIELLSTVYARTGNTLYADRVAETVGWLLREMRAPDGGFAASLDADSEGEEGRYYVWSAGEVAAMLGRRALLFCTTYDVSEDGNWDGTNILNRLACMAPLAAETESHLAEARARLFDERSRRVRPGCDDKVLADWNGLAIAALVRAGLVFDQPTWIVAAEEAFSAILRLLGRRDGNQARLFHSYRAGQAQHEAVADDYANMARAALLLEEATGNSAYGAKAAGWTETLDRHYWDAEQGGYFYTADDAEDLIARSRFVADNPTPNANGTMIEVHMRLYHQSGDMHYRTSAEALLNAFSGELQRNLVPMATYLNSFDFVLNAPQIVIRGRREDPETQALLAAVWHSPTPAFVVSVVAPGGTLPPGHPAAATVAKEGRATAHVCRGASCSLPVSDAAGLREQLDCELHRSES